MLVYRKAIDCCLLSVSGYLNGLTLLGIIICHLFPYDFWYMIVEPTHNGMPLAASPFDPLELLRISSIKLTIADDRRDNIPDRNRSPSNMVVFL